MDLTLQLRNETGALATVTGVHLLPGTQVLVPVTVGRVLPVGYSGMLGVIGPPPGPRSSQSYGISIDLHFAGLTGGTVDVAVGDAINYYASGVWYQAEPDTSWLRPDQRMSTTGAGDVVVVTTIRRQSWLDRCVACCFPSRPAG